MGIRVVDETGELEEVGRRLAGAARLALDCEAAGFHRYSDRLCLIQLSTDTETVLFDPLSVDPTPVLEPLLEDPGSEVVMHGADFDLRLLDRDLGIRVRGLFDTQVAASMLGLSSLGLSAVMERTLGVSLSKKYQRADWARRPLPPEMREYAASDTAHLLELADRLREELEAKGRLSWAQEESRHLQRVRWEPPAEDEDPVTRVKGFQDLSDGELARLRGALSWRDEVAQRRDRAPFRIAGNRTLLEAARRSPDSASGVADLPGMNRGLARDEGERLVELLQAADRLPAHERRGRPDGRSDRRGRPEPEVEERLARLKGVRNERAEALEMDRGTLLPNHVLETLAETPPEDLEDLAEVEGIQPWRVEALGRELLQALNGTATKG